MHLKPRVNSGALEWQVVPVPLVSLAVFLFFQTLYSPTTLYDKFGDRILTIGGKDVVNKSI
jgi:hypothetical protein